MGLMPRVLAAASLYSFLAAWGGVDMNLYGVLIMDKPKAILFDLDDTIIAWDAVAEPAWQSVCEKYASRIAGLAPQLLLNAICIHRATYWQDPERHRQGRLNLLQARRELVTVAMQSLDIDQPDLAAEMADAYSVEREELIYPLPGAIETLIALRAQGIRLGLITNGSAAGQRRKIERFGLRRLFDCILIEEEVGYGKPDERVYLLGLAALKVKADEAVMVGDNLTWDVEAPSRLGIKAIWVDNEKKGLPQGSPVKPFRIINSVQELL